MVWFTFTLHFWKRTKLPGQCPTVTTAVHLGRYCPNEHWPGRKKSTRKKINWLVDWPGPETEIYPLQTDCSQTNNGATPTLYSLGVSIFYFVFKTNCLFTRSYQCAQQGRQRAILLPLCGSSGRPFAFPTVSEKHQGSLASKLRPMFLGRPEFTCLVRTRVWMSFHTCPKEAAIRGNKLCSV